jgi:hypothetical protein
MQAITDDQRELLSGNRIEVDFGCEILNLDLTLSEEFGDITDDLVGGSVQRDMHNRIHGTCRLDLSTELPWGSVLVRPYMLLSDGGTQHRFNVGVFMLTTPEKPVGETPATFSAQGFDRLYLLDREVGADYEVVADGVRTYRDALAQVFVDAGLTGVLTDGAAADFVVPKTRMWPLVAHSTDPDETNTPVTWLRIVNDLQTAWNGRAVWADESGLYRCQAYQSPSVRAPEFVFTADDPNESIVGEQRTVMADLWKVPNRWVFIRTNRPDGSPAATEGDGIYTVLNQSDGPTSIDERGMTWTKVYEYEAASQAVLVSLGDRRVANDRRLVTTIKATTGPLPAVGHWDIYELRDQAIPDVTKVQSIGWEFSLDGGDVSHEWEAVS